MLIKSHEQLNQAVCETFFSSQLSKMGSKLLSLKLFLQKSRMQFKIINQKRVPYRTEIVELNWPH